MKRIGVWNTAFLGDAVLTLPLIRLLHAAWPEAEIDYYVRGGLDSLFMAQPELHRVYAYDKRGTARGLGGLRLLGAEVALRRYDLWIDAHLSLRSTVMAWMSRAKRKVGYAEASLAWWVFTDQVGRKFEDRAEIERLLALTDALGIPEALRQDEDLLWPELRLPLEAQASADRLLAGLPPGPLLGVHPGSVWPTKRWTEQGFAHIARRGLDAGANVLLMASKDEADTATRVRKLAGLDQTADKDGKTGERKGVFLDLTGKTSLPVLAALISRLQCYVTNDSGPMHLAWAQRTPVTALFGPTVEALGFFPRGSGSTVFQVEEPCRPCGLHGHKQCPQKHFRCMKNIDPETVWADVHAKLFPWKAQERERAARRLG